MDYRTFTAPTLKEAREMVLREMGTNAYLIKSTKRVHRRWLGLRKEVEWEVQAGMRNERAHEGKRLPPETKPISPEVGRLEKESAFRKALDAKSRQAPPKPRPVAPARGRNELERLADDILRFAEEEDGAASSGPQRQAPAPVQERLPARAGYARPMNGAVLAPAPVAAVSSEAHPVTAFLMDQDFDRETAEIAARKSGLSQVKTPEDRAALADAVAAIYTYTEGITVYETTPNVIFFIGPTGVGKTTTIPKIAFRYGVKEERTAILATFDLWRIMAVDMLRRYAEILDLPFEIIEKPADLIRLIKGRMDAHLIFVDTGGLPHGEEKRLLEIFDLVGEVQIPKEVHLCLNASMRERDLERVMKTFAPAHYDRILITKSDETVSLGGVLGMVRKAQRPLSFITNGQQVPDTFFLANRENLSSHLVKEWAS